MLTEQSFEELTASVKTAVDEIAALKVLVAKKGQDEDKDDQMEAFLKAQDDMDKEHKEATSDVDEIEKVKEAFKKAQNEDDEDKKMEAMKKAQEMKDEHDEKMAKKAKKGQDDDDEPNPTHTVEGTKIAALEKEIALPTINKILEATKAIDPSNLAKIEKKLKTASLIDIKQMWNERAPYVAALGLENVATPTQTFIPFQAGIIGDDNPETDFAKMDSEKLLSEMYR